MIQLSTKAALLFDGKAGEVKFVEYDGCLDSLYAMMDCDLVDTIRLDQKHIIFVDDEGLLKNYGYGFNVEYRGRKIGFVGSGVLVGDNFGETTAVTLSPSDLKIQFVRYERAESAKEKKDV